MAKKKESVSLDDMIKIMASTAPTQFLGSMPTIMPDMMPGSVIKITTGTAGTFTSESGAPIPPIMPSTKSDDSEALKQAAAALREMRETLERIEKEPLVHSTIERLSKDGKHCFVKKGGLNLIRIEATKGAKIGDEVLLHPESGQIVENLGQPPLEASRFAPDKLPNVAWADIGGLEQAKADMIEAIEMPHKFKALFAHYSKRPVKGILLAGPPGCGKTLLGKAAATSIAKIYGAESTRTGFLYVKGPEVLNMYVGESERIVRDIFRDAKRHKEKYGYPAIVFLDEADAILGARGKDGSIGSRTIVPQFLTEMDGLEESAAIIIIATNRPGSLDPAIVRDGRCDRKITVTRPDYENGVKILKLNLARVPLHAGNTIDDLSVAMADIIYDDQTIIDGGGAMAYIVNGAMLANVVDMAVSTAIRRDVMNGKQTGVNKEDAIHAVELVRKAQAGIKHNLKEAA